MPERYSRKDFLAGVMLTGLTTSAVLSMSPQARSAKHERLTLMTGEDSTGARQLLIEMWNETNPNTQVDVRPAGGETGDQLRDLVSAAQNGTADIVNLDTIHLRSFIDRDLISPVEVDDAYQFLDAVISPNRVSDDTKLFWAVPFNTDVGMLFERHPLGVEVVQDAQLGLKGALAQLANGPAQFVGQLQPVNMADNEAFVVNVLEHALAQDSNIIGADGLLAKQYGEWAEALEPLRSALVNGWATGNGSEGDSMRNYHQHEVRFMRNWPVAYRNLQIENGAAIRHGRIRVTWLTPGIRGGQSLALVKRSPRAASALRLIAFFTSEQAQKIIAMHGLAPTRASAYSDHKLEAFVPHLRAIRGGVEKSRDRPAHPNYHLFSTAIAKHIVRFLATGELGREFTDDISNALS